MCGKVWFGACSKSRFLPANVIVCSRCNSKLYSLVYDGREDVSIPEANQKALEKAMEANYGAFLDRIAHALVEVHSWLKEWLKEWQRCLEERESALLEGEKEQRAKDQDSAFQFHPDHIKMRGRSLEASYAEKFELKAGEDEYSMPGD